MPAGASAKRERQYEHIKESAERSGRYRGRAAEVAARTVNKQRRESGEASGGRGGGASKRRGRSSAHRSG